MRLRIGISGAGLGGLVAAIALARHGHEVIVFEASEIFQEIGAGIQLPPNASKHLYALGLGLFLKDNGVFPDRLNIYRWTDGKLIGFQSLKELGERFEGPYIQIKRSLLHEALQNVAKEAGVSIRTANRVVHYDFCLPSLTLEEGQIIERDFIIAADGVRSAGRKQLIGKDESMIIPTGYLASRASLHLRDMKNCPEIAELVNTTDQHTWIGPHRHIVTYTMLDDDLFNIVLVHPCLTGSLSHSHSTRVDDLKREFKGWDSKIQKLLDMMPCAQTWPILMSRKLNYWSARSGRFVLLGDAAHTLPPNLAQGTAMAIEDAVVLSQVLNKVLSKPDLPGAAQAYERARIERTSAIQNAATMNTALWHLEDGEYQKARDEAAQACLENLSTCKSPYVFGTLEGQKFLYEDNTDKID